MKEKLFSLTQKDFRVDTFRASGPGGQKRNKTDSAVRIVHIETGISAEAKDGKSQPQNRKKAFERLCNKPEFQLWLKKKTAETILEKDGTKKRIEQQVDKMMDERYLNIEYFEPKE